jgi:hypothetical protein
MGGRGAEVICTASSDGWTIGAGSGAGASDCGAA